MRSFATASVMLLATSCLGLGLAQAATPVIQGTSSVTNLSYALTDLKTSDWVAPSLKPAATSPAMYVSMGQTAGTSISWTPFASAGGPLTGHPFDTSSSTTVLSTGTASLNKQGNGFTNTLSVGSDTFQTLNNGDFFYGYRGTFPSADLKSSLDGDTAWVLSAYTQITITGQIAMDLQLDAQSLAQLPQQFGHPDKGIQLSTGLYSSIRLKDLSATESAPGTYDANGSFAEFSTNATQTVGANLVEAVVASPSPGIQTFSITLSNTTNKAMNIAIDLQMANYATWRAAPAPIPEPGTWALMALGLGLMGWRLRAGRARHALAGGSKA